MDLQKIREQLMSILDGISDHMDQSQGGDLKSLLDQSKMGGLESPTDVEKDDLGQPKGLSIEKVSLLGKKPDSMMDGSGKVGVMDSSDQDQSSDGKGDDDEMSEEELEELARQLASR